MKALVYSAPGEMAVIDVDKPRVRENQVLIKVHACGICKGADVALHNGQFLARFPLTPGHEFAGVVAEVGSQVTRFKIGDRVTADNTVLCGDCYYCRRNQPLYCENFYSLGCNGPGGFAEYVVVNQDKVFPVSDHLSLEEACFAEPTACAVHGLDIMDLQLGDDVLLYGAGPTGLILAQLLKHGGAGRVVLAASTQSKLDLAKRLGIDETVLIERSDYSKHEARLRELAPKGFDIVVDATGSTDIIENGVQFTKMGAKVVLFGLSKKEATLRINPYEAFMKELRFLTSFAQTHCFDRALYYLETGKVKVKDLITHHYKLEDYPEGFREATQNRECLKVMIHP